MSKAKVGSRNNPSARGSAKEFLYNGKKIKPVKLITATSTYFAAEYDNGELVVGPDGASPLPWVIARG